MSTLGSTRSPASPTLGLAERIPADRWARAGSDAGAAERSSGDSRTSSVPAPPFKEGSRRLLAPRLVFANLPPRRRSLTGFTPRRTLAGPV